MDKSYLNDSEVMKGLLQVLIEEGWFNNCTVPIMPEYECLDSSEDIRRGWQQLKERLQRDGIWEEEG